MVVLYGGVTELAGHELLHCKNFMHKVVGTIPFALTLDAHFYDEHTRMHHKFVGTPMDPTFAAPGTSVFTAFANTLFMSYVHTA